MSIPAILFVLAAEVATAPVRLPTVATVERIPLQRSPASVTLTLSAFNRRIELRPTRDSAGLASKIAAVGSRLCPRTLLDHNAVILECTTRRLDSVLVASKANSFWKSTSCAEFPGAATRVGSMSSTVP